MTRVREDRCRGLRDDAVGAALHYLPRFQSWLTNGASQETPRGPLECNDDFLQLGCICEIVLKRAGESFSRRKARGRGGWLSRRERKPSLTAPASQNFLVPGCRRSLLKVKYGRGSEPPRSGRASLICLFWTPRHPFGVRPAVQHAARAVLRCPPVSHRRPV